MEKHEVLPLGVVLEKRRIGHPWQEFAWKAVAVFPGAGPLEKDVPWKELRSGPDWTHYHSATLPLELFRRETEGYKVNLSQTPPRVFVVLRGDEEGDSGYDYRPFLVTVCPYEAQDYLDSGEELVDSVPMPDDLVAFVQTYIDKFHVDEPFYKRKRKPHDPRKGYGRGFERNPKTR